MKSPGIMGWTATERRYVEGERARRYVEGEGAICRAEHSQGRSSVYPRHVILKR